MSTGNGNGLRETPYASNNHSRLSTDASGDSIAGEGGSRQACSSTRSFLVPGPAHPQATGRRRSVNDHDFAPLSWLISA